MVRALASLASLAWLAACGHLHGGGAARPRATTGEITGLARDRDTGEPIENADIRARSQGAPVRTLSGKGGLYDFAALPPGRYTLSADFAGQTIEVANIGVVAGDWNIVDLVFTLGRPAPIKEDFNDPAATAIERFHPTGLAADRTRLEGTLGDLTSRRRLGGAVVSVVGPQTNGALQTVTDDQGRYRFDDLVPGEYTVSAYYSVAGHAQIEVRRSVTTVGGEAVRVPLLLEVGR